MSTPHVEKSPRRTGTIIAVLVVAAILAVLAAGGMWAWKYIGPGSTEKQSKTYEQPISALDVDITGGNIEVIAADVDTVEIERTLMWHSDDKPKSEETWNGESLEITYGKCGFNCFIDYRITLPADVSVNAQTEAGDVDIAGVTGEQNLSSDAGNVSVDQPLAKLSATSAAGDVTVTRAADIDATISSSAGNVDADFVKVPGKVDASSGAGDVTVRLPDSGEEYRVDAGSSAGDANVDVATGKGSGPEISAYSDAGNVDIGYR